MFGNLFNRLFKIKVLFSIHEHQKKKHNSETEASACIFCSSYLSKFPRKSNLEQAPDRLLNSAAESQLQESLVVGPYTEDAWYFH